MRIQRTFNGTGAIVSLGLGFIPDWVKLYNLESAAPIVVDWSQQMRQGSLEGLQLTNDASAQLARLGVAAGISIFTGTTLAAVSTAYLRPHANRDFRYQGTLGAITKWTLDTAGNKTGKFNFGVPTTHVGVGSRVVIRENAGDVIVPALITALSNDGDADNEVTLSVAAKTGMVDFLGPMYDLVGGVAGDKIPAGITIAAAINPSGNTMLVDAGTFDD